MQPGSHCQPHLPRAGGLLHPPAGGQHVLCLCQHPPAFNDEQHWEPDQRWVWRRPLLRPQGEVQPKVGATKSCPSSFDWTGWDENTIFTIWIPGWLLELWRLHMDSGISSSPNLRQEFSLFSLFHMIVVNANVKSAADYLLNASLLPDKWSMIVAIQIFSLTHPLQIHYKYIDIDPGSACASCEECSRGGSAATGAPTSLCQHH